MHDLSKPYVYLVGAGPGDPGLITLRGVECLERADVVLYDYLVNPVIACHAPDTAELVCLGRHGHSRIWSQDEINQQLLTLWQQGKTVVRLKGGDPAVFARGGEEAAFLLHHQVPIEVVPGITAALAAGSHAGIPLTHRDCASAVALVTGREGPHKSGSHIDYEALARFPGTLVFYMGVTTVERWSQGLLRHGMPPETPVAIVRRCSLPEQEIRRCRLDDVAGQLTPYHKMPPPVVVIVGPAAHADLSLDWQSKKPLFGQSVLVTRPVDHEGHLGRLLREQGATVYAQPTMDLSVAAATPALRSTFAQLGSFDWLVFSSRHGVRYFFELLRGLGHDLRQLGSARLAVVGPGTREELAKYHLTADLIPKRRFGADALADVLLPLQPQRPLLVRGSRGRDVLKMRLASSGSQPQDLVVYESHDRTQADAELVQRMDRGQIDWTIVTSPAIAESAARMFGASLQQCRLASISPQVSARLESEGYSVSAEALEASPPALVQALLNRNAETA